MMFGANHYVPVLKVKRGEKAALGMLSPSVQAHVTPLLEIVERTEKSVEGHLENAFTKLAPNVEGFSRCFIDSRELARDGPSAAARVFELAKENGIAFTPVTGVTRSVDVNAALAHRKGGLALRLTRTEFEQGGLVQRITGFMKQHKLKTEATDLIVDVGAVDQFITEGVQALAQAFLLDVPDQKRWRTMTLSACAFPVGMGGVERHTHDFAERVDWLAWRDALHGRRGELERLPTYSDGAIQHPKGVEGFDWRVMQASAAIRYTKSESWLLVKGEGTRLTRSSIQLHSLARKLVHGALKAHYAGPKHCSGCAAMKRAARDITGLGSLEAWRRLGTIHHITTVVKQLGALPWP